MRVDDREGHGPSFMGCRPSLMPIKVSLSLVTKLEPRMQALYEVRDV